MTDVQIIRTTAGEELVVLPRDEYEALRHAADMQAEDEADAALFDERMASLAAGGIALLPESVSAAMLRGASLLSALRKWRGMTQVALAARAGIGQGYLSDLESNRRSGTAETLQALAAILDIPADWLTAG